MSTTTHHRHGVPDTSLAIPSNMNIHKRQHIIPDVSPKWSTTPLVYDDDLDNDKEIDFYRPRIETASLTTRLFSRQMRERSIFAWCAELCLQFIIFCGPWLLPWSEFVHSLTTFLNCQYLTTYRILLFSFSSIPWALSAIVYFTLYFISHPFFERFRLQEWVWFRGDSNRTKQYLELVKRTTILLIFGTFIANGIVSWLVFDLFFDTTRDFAAYTDTLPELSTHLLQIIGCLIFFDTAFYWSHRLFHERAFVKRFFGGKINLYQYHKDHHAYYSTTALAGVWLDGLDSTVTSIMCGFIPLLFIRMHLVTYFTYSFINIFHSCYDHSGYHFAFDPFQLIPFGSHNDSHNGHHSMNDGNYGLYWRHWDVLCNTDHRWVEFDIDRQYAMRLFDGILQERQYRHELSLTPDFEHIISSNNDHSERRLPHKKQKCTEQYKIKQTALRLAKEQSIVIPMRVKRRINNSTNPNVEIGEYRGKEYTFTWFDSNNIQLAYGECLVKNGVGLLSDHTENRERENGEDNLCATLAKKTRQ
jgi:sterol desaturase/sphingolipid hydroxylase (fatty acid hydroxylase superfamily)